MLAAREGTRSCHPGGLHSVKALLLYSVQKGLAAAPVPRDASDAWQLQRSR